MKTVKDFNFEGKRALVRCDFNVPLDDRGNILDDFRIKSAAPTLRYLTEIRAKVILMSHLDSPGGRIVPELSLAKIKDRLAECFGVSIAMAPDCIGEEIEKRTNKMLSGEVLLLENLRFHKEEEENDSKFSEKLSKLGDIYINDAFSACHREHASIVGVPKLLPCGSGFLLEKEIKILDKLFSGAERPIVFIIGGKKVGTKAVMVDRFSEMADWILVGNLIERELKDKEIKISNPDRIVFPKDGIEVQGRILDIGPKTIEVFEQKISEAKTIFWNGPLGKIEDARFIKGTETIAKAIIKSGAFSAIGGGETAEFINKIGLINKFNHVSTGGGAMLAYLSGEKLPGLEALRACVLKPKS